MKITSINCRVNMNVLAAFLLSGCFLGCAFGQQIPKGWKQFTSAAAGYTAYYPSDWHRFPPENSPMLNVYSFPFSRAGGGVLPDGGASIAIVPAPTRIATVEDWIKADNLLARQESRSSITLQMAVSKKPLPVNEVISQAPEGMENVNCYFEIAGHVLVGRLIYWKGDTNATRLRQVLHGVIESIRLTETAQP
jgi:hypothetical protein